MRLSWLGLGLAGLIAASCSPSPPATRLNEHASVAFPGAPIHLVMTPEKMQSAMARFRERRPDVAELPAITAAVAHGESWMVLDRVHGESYTVLITPQTGGMDPASTPCAGPPPPGMFIAQTCRNAHAGGVRGTSFRYAGKDGGVSLNLYLAKDGKLYDVSYHQMGRASLQKIGAKPGDPANGERFLKSFRLDGQRAQIDG
jgi:hypothetical protein